MVKDDSSLSDKRVDVWRDSKIIIYSEKHVRKFIRRLKEDFENIECGCCSRFIKKIDKLAGSELSHE